MPADIWLKGDEDWWFWKWIPCVSLIAHVQLEADRVLLHVEEGKRPQWNWRRIDRINGVFELVPPSWKLGWTFCIFCFEHLLDIVSSILWWIIRLECTRRVGLLPCFSLQSFLHRSHYYRGHQCPQLGHKNFWMGLHIGNRTQSDCRCWCIS